MTDIHLAIRALTSLNISNNCMLTKEGGFGGSPVDLFACEAALGPEVRRAALLLDLGDGLLDVVHDVPERGFPHLDFEDGKLDALLLADNRFGYTADLAPLLALCRQGQHIREDRGAFGGSCRSTGVSVLKKLWK